MENTARLYHCARCHRQVVICRQCDRGNIYCPDGCAEEARRTSLRAAGGRYQQTRRGRLKHAERQRRRWETSAKTRDGTEMVARLVVVFALDEHPDDLDEEVWERGRFRTRFFGHKVSVWRAVTHRPIDAAKAVVHRQLRA